MLRTHAVSACVARRIKCFLHGVADHSAVLYASFNVWEHLNMGRPGFFSNACQCCGGSARKSAHPIAGRLLFQQRHLAGGFLSARERTIHGVQHTRALIGGYYQLVCRARKFHFTLHAEMSPAAAAGTALGKTHGSGF